MRIRRNLLAWLIPIVIVLVACLPAVLAAFAAGVWVGGIVLAVGLGLAVFWGWVVSRIVRGAVRAANAVRGFGRQFGAAVGQTRGGSVDLGELQAVRVDARASSVAE